MDENDKRQDMADQIKIGIAEESKEHKWMDKETVKKLVSDHLAIDPEYYGENNDEDDEEEKPEPDDKVNGYTKPRTKKAY